MLLVALPAVGLPSLAMVSCAASARVLAGVAALAAGVASGIAAALLLVA